MWDPREVVSTAHKLRRIAGEMDSCAADDDRMGATIGVREALEAVDLEVAALRKSLDRPTYDGLADDLELAADTLREGSATPGELENLVDELRSAIGELRSRAR